MDPQVLTARRQQPLLREHDMALRAIDHLPAMIAYWDDQGRNVLANAAYVEWFGRSPAELRGVHISELLGPELYALNLPYVTGALAGTEQLFERTLVDTAGRTRYTQAQYIPDVDAAGDVRGFFVLVTDITRRVQAESSLQHARTRVALLDDRQRIAADLHDDVIQRLFATGMSLATLEPRLGEDARALVARCVADIDAAMAALRSAIVPLRREIGASDVHAELSAVLASAATVLGFAPTLTFADPPELIPAGVVTDLLAVVREALSNVAKHARARTVHVCITTLSQEVRVQVADDGCGLGDATRSSGVANIRERAERLGGSARIFANDPHGTVVDWRVPTTRGDQP